MIAGSAFLARYIAAQQHGTTRGTGRQSSVDRWCMFAVNHFAAAGLTANRGAWASAASVYRAPDALRAPGESRLARQISLEPAATPERLRLARRLVTRRRPATEDYRPGTAILR